MGSLSPHTEPDSHYERYCAALDELARNDHEPHPEYEQFNAGVRVAREQVDTSSHLNTQLARLWLDAVALRYKPITPNHEIMWAELQTALDCVRSEIERGMKC